MSRQEDVQAGMAFLIAFMWPADVSMGWKLVTLGFLAMEPGEPVPAGTCYPEMALEGADQMPFLLVPATTQPPCHWPLRFALSPHVRVHCMYLFEFLG